MIYMLTRVRPVSLIVQQAALGARQQGLFVHGGGGGGVRRAARGGRRRLLFPVVRL